VNRIGLVIPAVVLMFVMNGAVCAAERVSIEAGINLWFNDWSREVPGFGAITSDTAMLIGPVIHAEFANGAIAEASYLAAGSDYRFTHTFIDRKTDRRDSAFAAGYMVIPEFRLLAGYKKSLLTDLDRRTNAVLSGPFIGARADLYAEPRLAFYIMANYLFTKLKQDEPAGHFQEKSPGWACEFGFRSFFTGKFTGTIGYKFETNRGRDSHMQYIFSGFTLGSMLAF